MNALIEKLKQNQQDHEFYPTTTEIIKKIAYDVKESYTRLSNSTSLLDIGAGNGKVLKQLEQLAEFRELYAIEKSEILRNNLSADIFTIGTDFYEQSLIDKTIDVTFCNPPYSQYEEWTIKILRESSSKHIYLVIPERWEQSENIKNAIEYRSATVKKIGSFDFLNSEDRSARAKVNLLRIDLSDKDDDAFDRFFNEEFKELKNRFKQEDDEEESAKGDDEENRFSSLILGKNYVENLVEMYKQEMANIRKNYDLVGKLDANLLREFDVTPAKVRTCLKERIKGLKNIYWHELISRMKEITDRLISKKRSQLMDTLNKNGHVDFTEDNIYAVVLWILKNATDYIDAQLIEVYEEAISKANCKNYKSNTRVFEYDRWRYNQDKPSHVFLEYRLVLEHCGRIERNYSNTYRLSENACEYLKDLLTIANNLSFHCQTSEDKLWHYSRGEYWFPGKPQEFRCIYKSNNEILMEVKAHLNGNIHVRFNQKFALALNVEYGRLKGWIHSGKQASEEMSDRNAERYFKSNFTLLPPAFMMIEGPKAEEKQPEEAAPELPKCTQNQTCEQLSFFNT